MGGTLYSFGQHDTVLINCGNPLYIPTLIKRERKTTTQLYFYCLKLGYFYMVARNLYFSERVIGLKRGL